MKKEQLNERKRQVKIAVGLASIDGGKPSHFTKKLLEDYEKGNISSEELRNKILKNIRNLNQDY